MTEYQVGDYVYHATFDSKQVEVRCPVCYGQKFVRVILGDDTIVRTPCHYCGAGFDGPRGFVTEYVRLPLASLEYITRRDAREEGSQRVMTYYSGHRTLSSENIFSNRADAEARAEALKTERDIQDALYSDRGRTHAHRKLSWSIGYHQRRAKKDRQSAEYHESRVIILKTKMKPEIEPITGELL